MRTETHDSDHHRAIDALALLVDGKASPADTARQITTAYEDSLKAADGPTRTDESNKVHTFWALWMCEAIRRFDGATRRLADLLVEISRSPDVETDDGLPKNHMDGSVYWRDLPGWSFEFTEHGLRESLFRRLVVLWRLLTTLSQGTTILSTGRMMRWTITWLKLRSISTQPDSRLQCWRTIKSLPDCSRRWTSS
jgi:hypothetical protein